MPDLTPLSPLLLATDIGEPWPPLWVMELSAKILLGAWLFYFGACVGSFLNVVVYRLPRGMNLVHPGSHCPHCGHAIRRRDNLPIFGWLLLGGQCRDCRAPISSRYFWVELYVALAFLLVFLCEFVVPRFYANPPGAFTGRVLLTPRDTLPFWCAYATHVLLITTLIAATLIDWDGFRTPRSLFWPLLVAGFVLPLVWPEIRRLPAWRGLVAEPAWQAGLIDGVVGLVEGILAGVLAGACWSLGSRGRGWPKFAPVFMLASVGVVLGWQRTLLSGPGVLVLFCLGLAALRFSAARFVIPYAALLIVAVSPWIVEIDSDVHHVIALAEPDRRGLVAAIVGTTALLWLIAGALAPPQFFLVRAPEPECRSEAVAVPMDDATSADAAPPNYSEDSSPSAPPEPPVNPSP
jgi:leader peptidase (prepilin peptidase)/N-methyltransferase